MDWTSLGNIFVSAVALIGGLAGLVQILQYLEQRRNRNKEAPQIHQGTPKKPLPLLSTIPNNLPPRGIFIGRDDKKQELYETIKSRPQLIVVEGVAGIGKTSLVLEVVYRCLGESLASRRKRSGESRFNAFIWITAKASSLTLEKILDMVARTLYYPYISQLESGERFNEVIN